MNVSLTPTLEAFVRRKVAEGLYGSASEVVREALRRQVEAEAEASTPTAVPLPDLVAKLRAVEPALRARGVTGLHVVGSHARGEARVHSDVDLLIDVDPNRRFHLLHLAAIQLACQEAIDRPTDVLTRGALEPEILAGVERDAVRVF